MKKLADYGFEKVNGSRWENENGYFYRDDFGDWYIGYKNDFETTNDGNKVLDIYEALVRRNH